MTSPNNSRLRLILELWIFTGILCFLVFKIGSFHNQFPDFMMIIWILLAFAGVGTFGAIDGMVEPHST